MQDFSDIRLQTSRLELRPLRAGDEAALFAMHSDPEYMRYGSSLPWTSIQQAEERIRDDQQDIREGKHLRLAIVRKADHALVGVCSLFHFDRQNRRAEIGYGIARECWRKGYVHEAASALIALAFSSLELIRLEADIDPRNIASARTLDKLGFVREGLLRQRWIIGDEISDSAIYGLLARDWRPAPGSAV